MLLCTREVSPGRLDMAVERAPAVERPVFAAAGAAEFRWEGTWDLGGEEVSTGISCLGRTFGLGTDLAYSIAWKY